MCLCVIKQLGLEYLQHHHQTPSFALASQVKPFPLVSLMVAIECVTKMMVCGTFAPF